MPCSCFQENSLSCISCVDPFVFWPPCIDHLQSELIKVSVSYLEKTPVFPVLFGSICWPLPTSQTKSQLKAAPRCCNNLKVLPHCCCCHKLWAETACVTFSPPFIPLQNDWLRPALGCCPRGTVLLGHTDMVTLLFDLSQSVCKVLHVHKLTSALAQRFSFPSGCVGICRDNNP